MENLKTFTLWFATGSEAAAALIIGLAGIEALLRSLLEFLRQNVAATPGTSGHNEKERIRLRLGRWLALALEFLVAADILRTAVAPSWDEIGKLAAIVLLRTALNFFLQREIDQAVTRDLAPAAALGHDEPPRVADR